jgi:hypothetical protein
MSRNNLISRSVTIITKLSTNRIQNKNVAMLGGNFQMEIFCEFVFFFYHEIRNSVMTIINVRSKNQK